MKRLALFAMLAVFVCGAPARADQAGFLYTTAVDVARYGDIVTSLDAMKPIGSPNSRVRPFADVFIFRDTKSANTTVPRIYNDNYAGAAIVLQYTTPGGFRAFAQVGGTTNLGSVVAVPSGGDFRGGLQYYREWGPANLRTYGNFYGSITYFSRYQDTLSYNQMEFGTRIGRGSHHTELYFRPTLTLDTHQYYYSNVAEVTAGIRFYPFGSHGPTLAFEEAAGQYLRGGLLPAGIGSTYLDFRPTLAYGVNI